MTNLNVEYLGIKFETPFVLASSPATANYDMIARAFEAGWAGAVIKTLIRERVRNVNNRFASNKLGSKIYAFENIELLSEQKPEEWYKQIEKLKRSFPEKAVIGSIMGDAKTDHDWLELARGCEGAGCDLIELNYSCPHGYPERGGGAAIGQSAKYSGTITKWIKNCKDIKIPIVPKLTAAVTDISFIGEAVASAGADGISAINTFPSLMGFDLKTLTPKASVKGFTAGGGYSGIGIKPIALRCISDLVRKPGLPVMACGGITSGFDAAEFIFLGAPIVQVCTTVMLEGYDVVSKMKKELTEFMGWHKYSSLADFLGKGNEMIKPLSKLDIDYEVRAVVDAQKCTGCKKCFISCRDGAYQAIRMNNDAAEVDIEKCGGCSLCFQVCPSDAITMKQLEIASKAKLG